NYYKINQEKFSLIPGHPISYWVSDNVYEIFKNKKISDRFSTHKGMYIGNNSYFLKEWYVISSNSINSDFKFYSKGQGFHKWSTKLDTVINWKEEGFEVKNFKGSGSINEKIFNRKCISWNLISTTKFSSRFVNDFMIIGDAAPIIFPEDDLNYILGFFNSKVADKLLFIMNPTINFPPGVIDNLPLILSRKYKEQVDNIVLNNIKISKYDYNSYEISWEFKMHPLISIYTKNGSLSNLEETYNRAKKIVNDNFKRLKKNEEKLNEIFIDIYGLEDELIPEVSDKDITITNIFDDKKDIYEGIKGNRYIQTKEDVVKSFISYAVGCMLGRYSLDEEGLIYAGGEWDESKYETFKPVKDNILLITNEEYFDDDIVNRFVEFMKVVYGEETLEENLKFIADSLAGRGSPRE